MLPVIHKLCLVFRKIYRNCTAKKININEFCKLRRNDSMVSDIRIGDFISPCYTEFYTVLLCVILSCLGKISMNSKSSAGMTLW